MPRILCPELVGRERELAQLEAGVDSALQGHGQVVFVTGAAGMGKSRLVADVVERARVRNITALVGRCVPSTTPVPYRPIGEALLSAAEPLERSRELTGFRTALGWLVPAWRDSDAAVTPESPVVVAEALMRALQAAAGRTALVFVIEDVQWADPESLHALEYVADHAGSSHVLCVCTLRDGAATEAAALITRLDARRAADVLPLTPLSAAEVTEMAGRTLGVSQPPPSIDALLRESADGVPFLVEELMAAAASAGFLTRADGRWIASTSVGTVVPDSFAASVKARLDALGPAGRKFLGAAALLGRSFDWKAAAAAVELSAPAAHAILDEAIAGQLLAVQGDGFIFRHALTRDAIVRELRPDERASLALRCVEELEQSPAPGIEWRHLAADLADAAGQPERAARHLLEAGRAALASAALDTAVSALQRASGLTGDAPLRAEVSQALAEALSATGDLSATRAAVDTLLEALAAVQAPAAMRSNAHLLIARCALTAAFFDVATAELRRARDAAPDAGDAALAARITAVEAHLAIAEGRIAEAMSLALRAADEAESTAQPAVVCEALEVATRCARTRDLDEAERVAERALRVATDTGLAIWRMRSLYQLGVVEMFRDQTLDKLRQARAEAERLGATATATTLDIEIAAGLEASFQHDEARQTCERCIEMAQLLGLRMVEAIAHTFIAITEAVRGSRAGMEATISRCIATGGADAEYMAAIWGDARAVASLALEDRARARRELETAVSLAPSTPAVFPRLATALLPLVEALAGDEPDFSRAEGVTRLNCQCAGYLAWAEAVHLGRQGRSADASATAQAADGFLRTVPWYRNLMWRLAAEAALEDGWGDPISWLTDAATFFESAGNDRLAGACRDLLRRAGVRVTRATRAAKALPDALRQAGVTPRESEVLALVGDGLGNRDIAGRLFLSERTVEQHIAALKQKLGARTRAQLAVSAAQIAGGATV